MAKDTYIKLCSGSKNDDLINVVFTLCSYIEKNGQTDNGNSI